MFERKYIAGLSARRTGAIGKWEPITVHFRIETHDLNPAPTATELQEATIKAAHQMGWEVNHINSVFRQGEPHEFQSQAEKLRDQIANGQDV